MDSSVDIDAVVEAIAALGLHEDDVREHFEELAPDADVAFEMSALAVESDSGLVLDAKGEHHALLVEVIDGFRRAGLDCRVDWGGEQPVIVTRFPEGPRAYRLDIPNDVDVRGLLRALLPLLPDGYELCESSAYADKDSPGVVVLGPDSRARLEEALGHERLRSVLGALAGDGSDVRLKEVPVEELPPVDFDALYKHGCGLETGWTSDEDVQTAWQRASSYDPRVPWAGASPTPPGVDFFDLSSALEGLPHARWLMADDATLATFLYRWALTALVGAQADMLACRFNPGSSAQGCLGHGRLTWAWFIFEALGAREQASSVGALLDDPWVQEQERQPVSARQEAWFDLGLWMRSGDYAAHLPKLRELLPLARRESWNHPDKVAAALKTHAERYGDQFTRHALYWSWPAPLYALARRAEAVDLLPEGVPFLKRPVDAGMVNDDDEMLARLREQQRRLDEVDRSKLPPLLDPLPVIIDVRVTEVDDSEARGHTLLADDPAADHPVEAPHEGLPMRVGDIWLLRAHGARQRMTTIQVEGLGETTCHVAVPTGRWLRREREDIG